VTLCLSSLSSTFCSLLSALCILPVCSLISCPVKSLLSQVGVVTREGGRGPTYTRHSARPELLLRLQKRHSKRGAPDRTLLFSQYLNTFSIITVTITVTQTPELSLYNTWITTATIIVNICCSKGGARMVLSDAMEEHEVSCVCVCVCACVCVPPACCHCLLCLFMIAWRYVYFGECF
jgi:hypothetical protein